MKEYLSPKMNIVYVTSTDIMIASQEQFNVDNPTDVVSLSSLFE